MGARVKDRSKGDIYSFAEENKPEGANAYWAATLNPYLYEHEKVIFYWHIDEEQAEKALSAEE
ncbi:MAG: hypothetical protein KKH88_04390 [Nanoarchaeota archaeon]|nr:hypothetical protein [Nanoarchaeota archaeon]